MHFYCIEKLNAVVFLNNISHGAFEPLFYLPLPQLLLASLRCGLIIIISFIKVWSHYYY